MTFSFIPNFLAKTQCPGQHSFDEFTIPTLLDFVIEDKIDHLLCPVQAVCEYLDKTRDCWPACSRLLVMVSDPRRAVHPHTLSKAYVSVSEVQSLILKVNAHEVRAIATSALFRKVKSLDLVLNAGAWKSMTTFVSFYLRDYLPMCNYIERFPSSLLSVFVNFGRKDLRYNGQPGRWFPARMR
ncbi:hypothetical protein E2C01_054901 [Portunus trituberculatus]|uniref:Uncharacterized protein n=1 Tax=Portunus trituberculatus TaxID=210409 RepID=A0A5B7GPU4_PORTR|nr:hypothetical protein [Portunus trituberculatus]